MASPIPGVTTSPFEIRVMDPDGDLIVVTGDEQDQQGFHVSSRVFGSVCKSWKAMLTHKHTIDPTACGEMTQLHLEDDDPIALEIILNIAHLRCDKVPVTVSFELLLALAMLTDKYQATQIVRPWIKKWISCVSDFINQPQFESFIWIAWEYGLLNEFEDIAAHFVLNIAIKPSGSYTIGGKDISEHEMPTGVVESVLDVRAHTIDRILAVPYCLMETCQSHPPKAGFCRHATQQEPCNAMTYGLLRLGLRGLGLWPAPKPSSGIDLSVKQLAENLRSLRVSTYHDVRHLGRTACSCNATAALREQYDEIMTKIPSSVTRVQREHIQAQLRVLGL